MSWVITPAYQGAAVSDADAQTYLRAVETADGQALEQGVQQAVNQFVIGCKADGIWTAIKASCILAGARTLTGALVPLAGTAPTKDGTEGGWAYNRKTGLQGNGSDNSINSNRANNVDPQNSKHIAAYTTSITTSGAYRIIIGAAFTAAGWSYIGEGAGASSNSNLVFVVNGATGVTRAQQTGLMGVSRSSSTQFQIWRGGSPETVNNTSQAPSSNSILVGSGTTSRLAFYSIGESIDLARLDSRVTDLINAFGTAIA